MLSNTNKNSVSSKSLTDGEILASVTTTRSKRSLGRPSSFQKTYGEDFTFGLKRKKKSSKGLNKDLKWKQDKPAPIPTPIPIPKTEEELLEEVDKNTFDEEVKDIRQHLKIKEVIKMRKQSLIRQKMEEAELDKSKKVEINHEMQKAT